MFVSINLIENKIIKRCKTKDEAIHVCVRDMIEKGNQNLFDYNVYKEIV